MANRFWVGGTASWNGTATGKWSTTSGGSSGAAEPTSSDDVFFDANSGAVTVTVVTTPASCKSLTFTGFTGTFAGTTAVTIAGNLTFATGMTLNYDGDFTISATGTVTSNGKQCNGSITFDGVGATFTIADALNFPQNSGAGNGSRFINGTLTASNINVTLYRFASTGTGTRVLNMGTGTWEMTGNDSQGIAWNINNSTNLTINASTSTLKFTSNSTSQVRFDPGVSMTYGTVWIATQNTGKFYIINNSFSCAVLKANPATFVRWTATKTITVATAAGVQLTGTAGNVVTLDTDSAGSAGTLSVSSGTISCDYMSIKDNTASGGATFYAGANSTSVSGNSGWIFASPSSLKTVMGLDSASIKTVNGLAKASIKTVNGLV